MSWSSSKLEWWAFGPTNSTANFRRFSILIFGPICNSCNLVVWIRIFFLLSRERRHIVEPLKFVCSLFVFCVLAYWFMIDSVLECWSCWLACWWIPLEGTTSGIRAFQVQRGIVCWFQEHRSLLGGDHVSISERHWDCSWNRVSISEQRLNCSWDQIWRSRSLWKLF